LMDPALGTRGIQIQFEPSDSESVTSFEIYRSLKADSLGDPILTDLGPKDREALIVVPDTNPPFKLFFGVRAIRRLETGEKLISAHLPIESLQVLSPVRIYHPSNGDHIASSEIELEVGVTTDQGILLRQSWWELGENGWHIRLDTCLPRNDCQTPLFGSVIRKDTITLSDPIQGFVTNLLCVQGSEVFDGRLTAQRQSLICTRFDRSKP
jgi:hypothetical protein